MNDMLDKLHEAGLMVMLDIVPNHMGYVQPADDYSALVPFNEST
jgi:1,4-alpha-glucan branching enzyme